jgi:hypothetical protein
MSLLRNTTCKGQPAQNYNNSRYLRKENNDSERTLFNSYWGELIGRYGTNVEYYTYNYSVSSHDSIYGEDPTSSFSTPVNIIMFADIASEAIMLSKFGIQTDADVTLLVTLQDYARVFGRDNEPKSGDVIRLTELGWSVNEVDGYGSETSELSSDIFGEICRFRGNNPATLVYPPTSNSLGEAISGSDKWIRCPQLFEITDRSHQDFTIGTNTLMGHYVWTIKAKRFDYSYQEGIDPECYMDDVGEETRTGLLSGYTQPQSPDKTYPGNAEEISDEIWDYGNENANDNDSVYGNY